MLTAREYENYKTKLQNAEKDRAVMEDRRIQLTEQLNSVYHLNFTEAKQELLKLKSEIEELESSFAEKYREFNEKWNRLSLNS